MPEETTLTRRKVLKRAGVGAAALWSVPFLTSTASAGVLTHNAHCTNPDGTPNCPNTCGAPTCGTKNGTTCFCFPGHKNTARGGTGCCKCRGNFFCSDAIPCGAGTLGCPSGFACTINCCGVTCAPACGRGISSLGGSGLTAAG